MHIAGRGTRAIPIRPASKTLGSSSTNTSSRAIGLLLLYCLQCCCHVWAGPLMSHGASFFTFVFPKKPNHALTAMAALNVLDSVLFVLR
jgi:hypothetical protein